MNYRVLSMPPKSLVGACSDDNYPVVQFLEKELGLSEGYYFPLRIPGGLAPLAYENELPTYFEAVAGYMRISLKNRPSIDELIVKGHPNCAFYKELLPNFRGNEKSDLLVIARKARILFPQIKHVRLFFMVPIGDKVDFQRIFHHLQPV